MGFDDSTHQHTVERKMLSPMIIVDASVSLFWRCFGRRIPISLLIHCVIGRHPNVKSQPDWCSSNIERHA